MRPETASRLSDLLARFERGVCSFVSEACAVAREELKIDGGANPPALLTARDVAAMLQTNVQTVYRLAREGQLPCVQTGTRSRRWTRAAVADFIERRGVAPAAESPAKPLLLLHGGR